jgi:hypothetical protein
MKFILVIAFSVEAYMRPPQTLITLQEFDSKSSCESAAVVVKAMRGGARTDCIPK